MLRAMFAGQRRPRVLMAVSEGAAERMCRILDGLEVERPAAMPQFVHALRCSSFDLVVVGAHFDGSRAIVPTASSMYCNSPTTPKATRGCGACSSAFST